MAINFIFVNMNTKHRAVSFINSSSYIESPNLLILIPHRVATLFRFGYYTFGDFTFTVSSVNFRGNGVKSDTVRLIFELLFINTNYG